jgi:hypothetical protein
MPIVQQKPIPFFIAKIEVINTTNMSHRIYDRLPEALRGKSDRNLRGKYATIPEAATHGELLF